jgi:hypothetical protein
MSEVSKVFDFACANPDYWALMREAHEPPEVSELDARRRQAFNAAREEVQRLSGELLDEIHAKIKARAAGTAMEDAFSKGFNRQSYEKARFSFQVFSGRGKQTWASIRIEHGSNGRVDATCGLGTSAARQADLLESFQTAGVSARIKTSGNDVFVEEPIALGCALEDIATRLVNVFWPGVQAYAAKLLAPAEQAGADNGVDDE